MSFAKAAIPEKVISYLNKVTVSSLKVERIRLKEKQRIEKTWVKDDALYFKTKILRRDSSIGVFIIGIERLNEKINRAIEDICLHRNFMLRSEEKDIRLRKERFGTGEKIFLTFTVDIWGKSRKYKKEAEKELEKVIENLNEAVELGVITL